MFLHTLTYFKKLYKYESLIFYCTRYLFIASVVICLYAMKYYTFSVVIVPYLLVIVFLSLIRYIFPLAMSNLLYSLEIEQYTAYIAYSEKKAHKKSSLQNYYIYRMAQFYYYNGSFEACILSLKQIDVSRFTFSKYGHIDLLDYYFLAYNARIRMDELEKLATIESHMKHLSVLASGLKIKKKIYLEKMAFLKEVLLEKKVNNLYCTMESHTKLDWIVKQYYMALSVCNLEDKESALQHYQAISSEDTFLFMVREARAWLNENKEER